MQIHPQQILDKKSNVERHKLAYRFQLAESEWCEIHLTLERSDDDVEGKWQLIEVFVLSHNYESNQMTLNALDNRLSAIICSKNNSARAWDVAKKRVETILHYLQTVINNYGIHYVFGKTH